MGPNWPCPRAIRTWCVSKWEIGLSDLQLPTSLGDTSLKLILGLFSEFCLDKAFETRLEWIPTLHIGTTLT